MKNVASKLNSVSKRFTLQCVEFFMENTVILGFVGIMIGNVSSLV